MTITDPSDEDPDDDSDNPDGDPCDGNSGPDCNAGEVEGDEDAQDDEQADEGCEEGSIIGCESGSLRERIAIPGTDLTLNYDSRLVPARLDTSGRRRIRVTAREPLNKSLELWSD